jgi:hypothetical protein
MNKHFAERIAEFAMAAVIFFTIGYVLWQINRAVLHHAFELVTR